MKNNSEIILVEPPSVLEGGILGRIVKVEGGAKKETYSSSRGDWEPAKAGWVDFMPGNSRWAEPSDFEALELEFPDPSTIESPSATTQRDAAADDNKD